MLIAIINICLETGWKSHRNWTAVTFENLVCPWPQWYGWWCHKLHREKWDFFPTATLHIYDLPWLKVSFGQQAVPVILMCCWSVLCGVDRLTIVYGFSDVYCVRVIHAVCVCVVWEPNGRGGDVTSVTLTLEDWWQHISVTPLIQINYCWFLI